MAEHEEILQAASGEPGGWGDVDPAQREESDEKIGDDWDDDEGHGPLQREDGGIGNGGSDGGAYAESGPGAPPDGGHGNGGA